MKKWLSKKVKENRAFLLFLILMFVFRSAFADWNTVPTGSMKPTIVEGDRILVNKMAYDVRVPFTHISLYKVSDPARGDIVIFDSDVLEKRLVKRVVGVPGDTVELRNNVLHINHQELSYERLAEEGLLHDRTENLLGIKHHIRVNILGSELSSFSSIDVPNGYYLVLGDNRDASADSRVIGLVPRKDIVGRSRSVVLSFDYDNYYIPRSDRFFKEL